MNNLNNKNIFIKNWKDWRLSLYIKNEFIWYLKKDFDFSIFNNINLNKLNKTNIIKLKDFLYSLEDFSAYEGIDVITKKPFKLLDELKKRPIFKKTDNEDFNQYAKDYYKDFPTMKNKILKDAKEDFPDLNIITIDMSGSFKRGNPNEDSDLDVKLYYLANISERDYFDKHCFWVFLYCWYWNLDIHLQRVFLSSKHQEIYNLLFT